MNLHVGGIDIAGLQPDSFSKAQAQGIGGEEENPVTQLSRGADQLLELPYRENIRDPGSLRRFDQGDVLPGLAQHSGVKELQAIEVELDRAPGTIFEQIVEIIEELIGGQIIDLAVEIVTNPPDCP